MSEMTRSERLLALLVLQALAPLTLKEKAVRLSSVGLSNTEVAEMLGTTPQNVAQSLYEARRSKSAGNGAKTSVRKRAKPSRIAR